MKSADTELVKKEWIEQFKNEIESLKSKLDKKAEGPRRPRKKVVQEAKDEINQLPPQQKMTMMKNPTTNRQLVRAILQY